MILTQRIGDTKTHSIRMAWEGRPFVPNGGWNLLFTVKDDPDTQDDAAARFQKNLGAGINVTGSTALVSVVRVDTAGGTVDGEEVPAVPPGLYYWDIKAQRIAEPNETRTVANGTLTLSQVVGRETGPTVPIFTTEPPLPLRDSVTVGLYPPENPVQGDQWLNEQDGFLYIYAWGAWVNPSASISLTWESVTGKPQTALRWPSWSEVTSKPAWTGTFTGAYSSLTGIPSTFTPATHYHNSPTDLFSAQTAATPDTIDRIYFADMSAPGIPFRFMTITELRELLQDFFDLRYWGIPGAAIPAGAYATPGDAGEGYYYTPGDYYTEP